MRVLVSGEGLTDMGSIEGSKTCLGPMAHFVDQWLQGRTSYSLIETDSMHLIPESEIRTASKNLKPRSKRGKKTPQETRYYYNNARALAKISKEYGNQESVDVMAVLFRDADGTASSGRGEWQDKHDGMIAGFAAEGFEYGVPMIPKPKSEAWIICALCYNYQNCDKLEQRSGNDASPHALKKELASFLGSPPPKAFFDILMESIEQGRLNVRLISMPSMLAFKARCDEVLDKIPFPARMSE